MRPIVYFIICIILICYSRANGQNGMEIHDNNILGTGWTLNLNSGWKLTSYIDSCITQKSCTQ